MEAADRADEETDVGPLQTSVDLLVGAVDLRDRYTGRHSEAVGELVRKVAQRLGARGEELRRVELAARLHDLGKLCVPDTILNKPGPLDEEEWAVMRRHPELGARMIEKVAGLEPVAPFVRSHHERWDGRGYPDGLEESDIPFGGRVIAACDAFEAMTSERPYRDALSVDEALGELAAGAGTQFDPEVVGAVWRESAPWLGEPVVAPAASNGRR
jgi:HD-GYP domain-containing protein (c-di-GMP phosphodiesterase class II)